MKNNRIAFKVALCGVFSGLALAFLLLTTVIPVGTYALPIVSGILLVAVAVEFNTKWAFAAYFAVSVLSFLLSGDKEAVLYFIMFFGFYPIVKKYFERIKSKVLSMILKYLLFNACMIGEFFIGVYLLGIPAESFSIFGVNLPLVFLALGNIAFYLYDKCVTVMIGYYITNLRKRLIR
ncbi:MAG: hypothetical protein PUB41_02720 [bacterium]|nr:hypothetical protein [bacterium]